MLARRSPLLAVLAAAVAAALTLGLVVALGTGGAAIRGNGTVAAPPPSAVASIAAWLPAARATAAPTVAGAPSTQRTVSPSPHVAPLPALVGAIGDSLTVAVDAEPRFGDQPEHSWVLGTATDDGVESHLERLRALGADPGTAMAARPGARVGTAVAQAERVVAAARGLPDDGVAYVTFELGANDVCAPTLAATTDPGAFAASVGAAFATLADGLPRGSTLLVLSVPDVTRLRSVLENVPRARALHRQYDVCRAVLGEDASLDGVRARIGAYNQALVEGCESLEGSTIDCRHDQAGPPAGSLFGASFELEDLSGLDFFHPSLRGQARIADVSWRITPWGAG